MCRFAWVLHQVKLQDGEGLYYTMAVTIKSLRWRTKVAMDFMNRSTQPQQPAHQSAPTAPTTTGSVSSSTLPKQSKFGKPSSEEGRGKLVRAGAVGLLFALTILVVSVIGVIFFGGNNDQGKFVDNSKYQAVFLTNGQVYFGKLNDVSKDYFKLQDIYYLTQNTTTSSSGTTSSDGNYTLVKLGCQQIHDPYDQMVIERDQVSFWENLQDSGKVVTSINQFVKQNPKGPDCSQVSTQTQASSDTSTQQSSSTTGTGTSTNGTSTTGSTSTGTSTGTGTSTKNP